MALIEQLSPGHTPVVIPEVDERAARATLRDQISHLERELVSACLDACPRLTPPPPVRSLSGPRMLSLGELERVRDELAVLGAGFIYFTDERDGRGKVLYVRHDGDYGVVEPPPVVPAAS